MPQPSKTTLTPAPAKPRRKGRSVFRTVMAPLLALVLAEALLLTLVLFSGGVVRQLDQNAEDILEKQVQSRANYLAGTFTGWADLQRLSTLIGDRTQAMLDSGEITLDGLDDDSAMAAPLLLDVTDDLISTLYDKRLTGIYIVFNTEDLSGVEDSQSIGRRTGVYIRDLAPASPPSVRNEDLLWERCPVPVVQSLDITTDTIWRPQFEFPAGEPPQDRAFFVEPLRAAYADPHRGSAEDYGYWGAASNVLLDSTWPAVTYSVPLMLEDGTIYGVLGVGVLVNYLETFLPHNELLDREDLGAYLMAVTTAGEDEPLTSLSPMLISGQTVNTYRLDRAVTLEPHRNGYLYHAADGTDVFLAAASIPLYSPGTPFESQRWVLLGAAPTDTLYTFSRHTLFLLLLDVIAMALLGLVGGLLISRRLSAPIRRLSRQVEEAQSGSRGRIPALLPTGITEIDRFSGAIVSLSQDVIDTSTRFLQIIHLASVELGGFEIKLQDNSVYVTENFFPMLGLPGVPTDGLTTEDFWDIIRRLDNAPTAQHTASGSALYQVEVPPAPTRYIRVDISEVPGGQVGVAEDVTAVTLERLRAERERDYDLLTGLLNRRAFQAKAEEVFKSPATLGYAALMMLDLDNLKFYNDHYGHDCGDAYIRQAGACFARNAPAGALCSRVSGDEFFLLFYGYPDRDSLRRVVDGFCQAVRDNVFCPMEGGDPLPVSASGGVAWYPEDASDLRTLMKYADFAMYQVKRERKGLVGEFDLGAYNRESFLDKSRQEFLELLREEQVFYHFQPIVSAVTGEVFAYEALMRTQLPTLHSPDAVLKIAREMGRLQDVESLTWFKAPQCFRQFLASGQAKEDAYLFVNSIASQCMPPRSIERFRQESGDLQPRMVVEITEADGLSVEAIKVKRNAPYLSGLFALDDYGSGYSNERTLIDLAPQFVKVDLSIIRDIDTHPDQQSVVANLVSYAHQRNIQVVAEGIETPAELETVLGLGVDLLQGYLLSRPAVIPQPVPPTVLERIRAFHRNGQA